MIKHPKEIFDEENEKELIITIEPNYHLKREDKLVLFGRDENIKKGQTDLIKVSDNVYYVN